VTANRSITGGCSSTSGTGSSPSGTAPAASRAAAHSSAFARARVGGAAAAATCRAKPAAPAGTEAGRQPAIYPATPDSGTGMDASQRNLSTGPDCGHPEPPRI
jgi:hypothetical protein